MAISNVWNFTSEKTRWLKYDILCLGLQVLTCTPEVADNSDGEIVKIAK